MSGTGTTFRDSAKITEYLEVTVKISGTLPDGEASRLYMDMVRTLQGYIPEFINTPAETVTNHMKIQHRGAVVTVTLTANSGAQPLDDAKVISKDDATHCLEHAMFDLHKVVLAQQCIEGLAHETGLPADLLRTPSGLLLAGLIGMAAMDQPGGDPYGAYLDIPPFPNPYS